MRSGFAFIFAAFLIGTQISDAQESKKIETSKSELKSPSRKRRELDEQLDERMKGKPLKNQFKVRGKLFLRKLDDGVCALPYEALDLNTRKQLETLIAKERESES